MTKKERERWILCCALSASGNKTTEYMPGCSCPCCFYKELYGDDVYSSAVRSRFAFRRGEEAAELEAILQCGGLPPDSWSVD